MHTLKRGHFSDIKKVGTIGFINALGFGSVVTIWAIYLDSILKNPSYVGFLTAFFMIIGTITYIFAVPFLEKHKKSAMYSIIILLFAISYFLFSFVNSLYLVIILGIVISILGSLRISLYGIIVRDKTKDDSVSKNEGFIYTVLNLSYLIAPIAAGYLASKFGVGSVFLAASGLFIISFFSIKFFKVKDNRKTKNVDKNFLKVFISFFKDKKRVYSYILSGGVDFWWTLIYIYVPILIVTKGLGDQIVGYFLAAIVVPLILIEYKIGKYVNKKGFKKVLFAGYIILGSAALLCFFIENTYFILGILVLSSFGAAMIEPMSEAYFFDIIKKKERDKFYPAHNTAINVGSFFARFLSAIVLLVLPFKFVFVFFALSMFVISFFSAKIQDVIEKIR